MKKDAKKDSFWLSYSDLMTSLFFVMLVLFITGICILTTSDQTMAGLKAKLAEAEDKIEKLEKDLKKQTAQYNDLKDKANAKVEPKMRKAWFAGLRKEMFEKTDALYEKLSAIVAEKDGE